MRFVRLLFLSILLMLSTSRAFAVDPGEALPDAALEARARAISAELRCLVCQNQSIDDSNAGLARDLRLIVRERLTLGESDEKVVEFVVSRFGNYVLLKPPLQSNTFLLWLSPGLVLVGALSVFLVYTRRRNETPAEAVPPLTPDEIKMLNDMRDKST